MDILPRSLEFSMVFLYTPLLKILKNHVFKVPSKRDCILTKERTKRFVIFQNNSHLRSRSRTVIIFLTRPKNKKELKHVCSQSNKSICHKA